MSRVDRSVSEDDEVASAASLGHPPATPVANEPVPDAPNTPVEETQAASIPNEVAANNLTATNAISLPSEEEFSKLFDNSPRFDKFKKIVLLITVLLTVAITVLFAPADTATYSIAFGLAIASFVLSAGILLLDAYKVGKKREGKIIEVCGKGIEILKNQREIHEYELKEFNKLKLRTHLKLRTSIELISLIFTLVFAILKFAGMLAGNSILGGPYFLLVFMVVPIIAKGICDIFLKSNIKANKKELIDFYSGLNESIIRAQLPGHLKQVAELEGRLARVLAGKISSRLAVKTFCLLSDDEILTLVDEVLVGKPGVDKIKLLEDLADIKEKYQRLIEAPLPEAMLPTHSETRTMEGGAGLGVVTPPVTAIPTVPGIGSGVSSHLLSAQSMRERFSVMNERVADVDDESAKEGDGDGKAVSHSNLTA